MSSSLKTANLALFWYWRYIDGGGAGLGIPKTSTFRRFHWSTVLYAYVSMVVPFYR